MANRPPQGFTCRVEVLGQDVLVVLNDGAQVTKMNIPGPSAVDFGMQIISAGLIAMNGPQDLSLLEDMKDFLALRERKGREA